MLIFVFNKTLKIYILFSLLVAIETLASEIIVPNEIPVSMIKLISSPTPYEGKEIFVSGFLIIEVGEPPILYFSKESYQVGSPEYLIINDFDDNVSSKMLTNHYVTVKGMFQYKKYNSPLSFAGVLENVDHIYLHR